MIRVGFPPVGGALWMGGRNYLWNLFRAVLTLDERQIQPVLMCGEGEAKELEQPGIELFVRRGPLAARLAARVGSTGRYFVGRDLVEDHWAARARVDVLSHGAPLGRGSVPWIYWIPDVQHKEYPQFFSDLDRRVRDAHFRAAFRHAAVVMTSSSDSRNALVRHYGEAAARVRVLNFVSAPRVEVSRLPSKEMLAERFGAPERYFHLPNQFWKHKNHVVVVEAVALALAKEPKLTVLATGAKDDRRNPEYYDALMQRARELGLTERFRHLGMVSYDEMVGLMRHSVAVLNPSLFEGWSSTVEESKSLGKTVLLSEIPVHREQAPARGHYFPAHDPSALSSLLLQTWESWDPDADEAALEVAQQALPARMRAFGRGYQDLVIEATRGNPPVFAQ